MVWLKKAKQYVDFVLGASCVTAGFGILKALMMEMDIELTFMLLKSLSARYAGTFFTHLTRPKQRFKK